MSKVLTTSENLTKKDIVGAMITSQSLDKLPTTIKSNAEVTGYVEYEGEYEGEIRNCMAVKINGFGWVSTVSNSVMEAIKTISNELGFEEPVAVEFTTRKSNAGRDYYAVNLL